MQSLSIGQVAKQAGIAPSALRYYESVGLLPRPERVGGRRRYSEDVIIHLRAIDVAKQAGFRLEEIKVLLRGFPEGTPLSRRWRRMASTKIAELDALIDRADRMKTLLRAGLACNCLDLATCRLVMLPRSGRSD